MLRTGLRIFFLLGMIAILTNCENKKQEFTSNQKIQKLEWNSNQFFMNSTSQGVMISKDGVTLENQILIEDDAPAFGYSSDEGSIEILKEGVLIKKILRIDQVPVGPAKIAMNIYPDFPPEPNNGRHLVFNVNGHEIIYEVKHFWTDVAVPVAYLRQGDNIITVKTLEPDTRFRFWISLDRNARIGGANRLDNPNRSARSVDDGKTWDFDHLGERGIVDGEYPIRLKLSNYHASGWLESPIIDMAQNSDIDGIKQPAIIESGVIKIQQKQSEKTHIEIKARTGATQYVSEETWNDWQLCEGGKISESLLKYRFMQFRVNFYTLSPEESPIVNNVELISTYRTGAKNIAKEIKVVSLINKPMVLSSYSFQYEDPKHPKLRELRNKYKLDDLIAGCTTEFEKMLKLRSWVAQQWNWHLLKPEENIIEWNALEILAPDKDGNTSGGYCLHYAIVYMQVLQSFGFYARIVNTNYSVWSGHEMTEVWSNEFGKWILMDANFDTHFIDKSTGIPLNALELHNIFLEQYYPGQTINRDDWNRIDFVRRAEAKGKPDKIDCVVGGGAQGGSLKEYEWWKPVEQLYEYCGGFGFLNTGFLRYLPRNNFLSEPYPIPLNHGRTHWGWNGYYSWYDDQTPRTQEHSQFTNRKDDLYWNLNEVYFTCMLIDRARLQFSLATNSPYFTHYKLTVNGTIQNLKNNQYILDLVPGNNNIKFEVIDVMNNIGPSSMLKVNHSSLEK